MRLWRSAGDALKLWNVVVDRGLLEVGRLRHTCGSTFVFLQSLLSGLKHRFMELLSKFFRGEAVPRFCASIDTVKTLFRVQGEWGPQAVQ